MSNYDEIKSKLIKKKELFEDPDFPATPSSLADGTSSARLVKWLRPSEIVALKTPVTKPVFTVQRATRFDLYQGEIGDCWFIAAVACLAVQHEELLNRCIPPDQSFDTQYAGIFRFNFWHFGNWVEVVVDDRLPTLNGEFIYARNSLQPNEFWVPLIEKAYAKINGGYSSIAAGGHTCNALVDFTGGISECIDLRKQRMAPPAIFDTMYAMMAKCSMLACDIEAKMMSSRPERNGLYKGHAYSITNMIRLTSKGQTVRLLRLRNPWGKDEWNGKWSDKSAEWAAIPAKAKQEIGLENKEDGEFWMSYEDFAFNLDFAWLCHLEPDAISEEIGHTKGRTQWEVTKFEAEWVRGFNAGGCGNPPNKDLFWKNSQFGITLKAPSADDATGKKAHMIISLMQDSDSLAKNVGMSFLVYKIKPGTRLLLSGENYESSVLQQVGNHPSFINLREVTEHYELEPGNYVIIPCTFEPNLETKFMLRIFTELPAPSEVLDTATAVAEPTKPVEKDTITTAFSKATKNDNLMDARELTTALNDFFQKDVANGFTADTARNLITMISVGATGVLTLDEFRKVVLEVTSWTEKFKLFDKDRSGDIDTYEIENVFKSIGVQVSRQVMESVVRRYSGKKRRLCLEDFILCSCRITVLYDQFRKLSTATPSGTNPPKITLSLEQWIASTV